MNCCVFKKIPVELLSAAVAKGHIFPLQARGASGADGIGVITGVDGYFGNRQWDPVCDCFQKQARGMPFCLFGAIQLAIHGVVSSLARKPTGEEQKEYKARVGID